jgi:ribose 5-phosphate isomerase B
MVDERMATVAVGADHAGFALKQDLKSWLTAQGHTVLDFGTYSGDSVDYPDFAAAVSRAVSAGEAACGVLVCGTGIGMAIAANKVPGIRAGVCGDVETARLSRQHNDLNVLALAGRLTPPDRAIAIVRAWLETPFEGGRHERRLAKVSALEVTGAAAR